jgi:hypothetical protein
MDHGSGWNPSRGDELSAGRKAAKTEVAIPIAGLDAGAVCDFAVERTP